MPAHPSQDGSDQVQKALSRGTARNREAGGRTAPIPNQEVAFGGPISDFGGDPNLGRDFGNGMALARSMTCCEGGGTLARSVCPTGSPPQPVLAAHVNAATPSIGAIQFVRITVDSCSCCPEAGESDGHDRAGYAAFTMQRILLASGSRDAVFSRSTQCCRYFFYADACVKLSVNANTTEGL